METVEFAEFEKVSADNYNRWMIPLVDDALEVTKGRAIRVLDVACGPGLLTKELAKRDPHISVSGVDNSLVALRLARKNCNGLKNVSFSFGSVERLPFSNSYFDLVICKDSFHHFNNPKYSLREMLRVTRPGGTFYLQDLRRDLPWYLLRTSIPHNTVFKKLQFYSTRAAYTKSEVEHLLKQLHIERYRIRTRKISRSIGMRYAKLGIAAAQLRAAFQSRYVLIIQRN